MIASKRFSFILTTLLLGQSVVTSPVPINGTTSELVLDLFESLTGVVTKAGNLITKIADMADADQVKETGEEISNFGDKLDDDAAEAVSDGFQKFLEFLPQIKNNITEVLKKVPEIQTKISEQVNNIPPKADIKERVNSLLENLPENEGTSIFKETVNTHIDNLPSNSEINEMIDATVDQIPSADYIHEKLDEFVDQ